MQNWLICDDCSAKSRRSFIGQRYSSRRQSVPALLECHLFYFNYALLQRNKRCVPPDRRISAMRYTYYLAGNCEQISGIPPIEASSVARSHHSLILRSFIVERTTECARAPSVLIAVISLEFIHPVGGRKASRGGRLRYRTTVLDFSRRSRSASRSVANLILRGNFGSP